VIEKRWQDRFGADAMYPWSLAIAANILRVLDEKGVRVHDLPRISGVSKESIAMAFGVLKKHGAVAIGADPAVSRFKAARLTERGLALQEAYRRRLAVIEELWQSRFSDGLPGPWGSAAAFALGGRLRASRRDMDRVAGERHRGGFPDGS